MPPNNICSLPQLPTANVFWYGTFKHMMPDQPKKHEEGDFPYTQQLQKNNQKAMMCANLSFTTMNYLQFLLVVEVVVVSPRGH